MVMGNTVYLLGAGASHSYGESPTGVRPPLARGFFESYSALAIAEDLEVRVGSTVNHVRDTYGLPPEGFGLFEQDIEQFMTHLDIQVRELAQMVKSGLADTAPAIRAEFLQAIKAYDEMILLVAHVLNEIQNGPVSQAYSALVKSAAADDVFITFNWDTLLDHALSATTD